MYNPSLYTDLPPITSDNLDTALRFLFPDAQPDPLHEYLPSFEKQPDFVKESGMNFWVIKFYQIIKLFTIRVCIIIHKPFFETYFKRRIIIIFVLFIFLILTRVSTYVMHLLQENLQNVKSAPIGSLVWRLAMLMGNLHIYNGSNMAVAHMWTEFILELRYRLEKTTLICGYVIFF